MMEAVFLKIFNISITASWIVLAVLVVRILLKKAPKWITVLMWGLVSVRLVCPFSLESRFSLIPSAETVPSDILYTDTPAVHSGVAVFNSVVNPIISKSLAPSVVASANPMQVIISVVSIIWIVGIAVILAYTVISYLKIYKMVREAVLFKDNIWVCDHVDTPFILGMIRPRIYLPSAMSGQDLKYVIAHERAHLKRHDHWWKPLGFLLLTFYWFNPILWIAYILLCRDIELACDEKVIRDMGIENKKPYSNTLINCSAPRRTSAACPLAFGEAGVKVRVKSVLNYKKPTFWILVVDVISFIIVAVCFLTNPISTIEENGTTTTTVGGVNAPQSIIITSLREQYPQYFDLDDSNGLDVYVWQLSKNSYYFGLLPHTETERDWLSTELLNLQGTDADEMRQILSAYNISENDIHIIPWQNPISSYLAEPWIVFEGENVEEKQKSYMESVRNMLFGK